ncbi:XdhC family protein [Aquimarina sp. 2201CG1-2-11]|uniref:XdhC family protein n=1 Tax=Aquimarina discodermiae TaxID=3231043 RepID=UPI0034629F5F
MTHEFKEIIEAYSNAKQLGMSAVLATVVDIEGSSYRRPGVGMLILENNKMIGAVSGGCVEKEVLRQAQYVFVSGKSRMMTYDGKYRLGCEGLLYILIEKFDITFVTIDAIKEYLVARIPFRIETLYSKTMVEEIGMGSILRFGDDQQYYFSETGILDDTLESFDRDMQPCFRLVIIGTEHDAEQLCKLAAATKWEVTIVCSPQHTATLEGFPGANKILYNAPEDLEIEVMDRQTAIVLMNHNFAKDLLYLQALKNAIPIYIGVLGPAKRREKLLSGLLDYSTDITEEFIALIHGPAGLNLGAETPEEIAISIIAEILSVIREQDPIPLHKKKGAIHDTPKKKDKNVIIYKA